MNGRNDELEIEEDGFITAYPPLGVSLDTRCPKCLDTGYRRDWRGMKVQCEDCWNDNGPES